MAFTGLRHLSLTCGDAGRSIAFHVEGSDGVSVENVELARPWPEMTVS